MGGHTGPPLQETWRVRCQSNGGGLPPPYRGAFFVAREEVNWPKGPREAGLGRDLGARRQSAVVRRGAHCAPWPPWKGGARRSRVEDSVDRKRPAYRPLIRPCGPPSPLWGEGFACSTQTARFCP